MFPGNDSHSMQSQHQSQSLSTIAKSFVGNEMFDGKMVGSFKYFFTSLDIIILGCVDAFSFFFLFSISSSIFSILYLRSAFLFFFHL